MGPLEAMAVEALKRALMHGSAAAGEQVLREVLSVLPPARLLVVKRICDEVIEGRKPKFDVHPHTRSGE